MIFIIIIFLDILQYIIYYVFIRYIIYYVLFEYGRRDFEMENKNQLQNSIFAYIFKLSNTLQVYLDQTLIEDGLTSKQMFLMIVIDSFGEANPTFKEAAERSGSSYQNIKQIALKLQKQDYVTIISDSKDKRAKRLVLTDKAKAYWKKRDLSDVAKMDKLFKRFEQKELENFFDYMNRLLNDIEELSAEMEVEK